MNTLWSQGPVRAAGERPTVIGLHTAAGTPDQWRPLAERLGVRYPEPDREIEGFLAQQQARSHAKPPDPVINGGVWIGAALGAAGSLVVLDPDILGADSTGAPRSASAPCSS